MQRALTKDRAAEVDLIEIWVWTFDHWGVEQADRYLGLIDVAIRALADDPTRGRSRESLRPEYRSLTTGHHVIFFTHTENEVRIRRVLHEVMDFDSHLE